MAKFFDWTTLLLRNAFSNDDGKDQRSDRHRHRRDDGKGDPAKRDDDDDVFKYQTTGGREQSDVREESRRRREKDEGEKKKRINIQMLRVLKNQLDSASMVKDATRIFLLRKRSRDESNASARKY